MYLIQLLLPLHDNNKQPFPRAYFNLVREDLTTRFGGVTAFVRSPAVGLWQESAVEFSRDDVVMFEVLTDDLDKAWWAGYRQELQKKFKQEELLIWASSITKL
ncbi:MAG TPA: hypothetical protein VLL54_14375 [Pyrinomonadaceae bacterium]|nr:hypothetical protein [Pyrinomonadaceae bacterium]